MTSVVMPWNVAAPETECGVHFFPPSSAGGQADCVTGACCSFRAWVLSCAAGLSALEERNPESHREKTVLLVLWFLVAPSDPQSVLCGLSSLHCPIVIMWNCGRKAPAIFLLWEVF